MTKILRVLAPAFVLMALATSGCYVTSTPRPVVSPRPWPVAYERVPSRHGPYERHPDPRGGAIDGHWDASGHVRVTGQWQ